MFSSLLICARSCDETCQIGRRIGELATAGLVIAFRGDLGSGKTALIQGIAKGLEVPDTYYVTSPSYTLVNEYPGRLPLIHLDLYRLSDADFDDIGLYDILNADTSVVAIEWAERLLAENLRDYLAVQIDIIEPDIRNIRLSAYGKLPEQLLAQFER